MAVKLLPTTERTCPSMSSRNCRLARSGVVSMTRSPRRCRLGRRLMDAGAANGGAPVFDSSIRALPQRRALWTTPRRRHANGVGCRSSPLRRDHGPHGTGALGGPWGERAPPTWIDLLVRAKRAPWGERAPPTWIELLVRAKRAPWGERAPPTWIDLPDRQRVRSARRRSGPGRGAHPRRKDPRDVRSRAATRGGTGGAGGGGGAPAPAGPPGSRS